MVGIINSAGEANINPDPETVLNTSDTILLMGDVHKMDLYKESLPS